MKKLNEDKIVDQFTEELMNQCKIALITIYNPNTKDYPGKFVARMFDVNIPTIYVVLADTLDEIRSKIPEWMTMCAASKDDDIVILETYI